MLRAELDRLYEPPTVVNPAELPDPSPNPYPLARIDRADMGIWALLAYLIRVWAWRRRDARAQRVARAARK